MEQIHIWSASNENFLKPCEPTDRMTEQEKNADAHTHTLIPIPMPMHKQILEKRRDKANKWNRTYANTNRKCCGRDPQ